MKIRRQNLLVGFLTGFSVIPQVYFVQFSIVCSYDDPNSPNIAQPFHCEYENKITSIVVNPLLTKKKSQVFRKIRHYQKQNPKTKFWGWAGIHASCRDTHTHPSS
jgi:hypothetical protein